MLTKMSCSDGASLATRARAFSTAMLQQSSLLSMIDVVTPSVRSVGHVADRVGPV